MKQFLLLVLLYHVSSLTVSNDQTISEYNSVVVKQLNEPLWNSVYGPIIWFWNDTVDMTGSIGFIHDNGNFDTWTYPVLNSMYRQGAIAAIYHVNFSDSAGWASSLYRRYQFVLPIVEIGNSDWESIFRNYYKENTTVHVNITQLDGYNAWGEVREAFTPAISVICGTFTLVCLALAVWKIVLDYNIRKVINVAKVCLGLEVVSLFIRLLYTAVDPFWSGRLVFPHVVQHIFLTCWTPLQQISTLLVAFYWVELIKDSVSSIPSSYLLNRFKIPFAIVSTIMIVLEIASTAARALGYFWNVGMQFVTMAFYAVILLSSTAFFLYAGIKMLLQLQDLNESANAVRIKTTKLILASAVGDIGFFIVFIASLISFRAGHPWLYYIALTLVYLFANVVSVTKVLAFHSQANSNISRSFSRMFTSTDSTK
eukprot:TRINITY_DN7551_c0_g2_i2.p1 TRINITY_DN7551_c0_g2~~TRINITY_DN7551_c0_g2_i2.p1  ORF type:complete len:432 (+),score=14.44 TRINITY_DN7551_c0_g2_i2:23-1297(+)